jgi:hypothetical protein
MVPCAISETFARMHLILADFPIHFLILPKYKNSENGSTSIEKLLVPSESAPQELSNDGHILDNFFALLSSQIMPQEQYIKFSSEISPHLHQNIHHGLMHIT